MIYTGTTISGGNAQVHNDGGTSWAQVRALGTGATSTGDPINIYASYLNPNWLIGRGFIPFDTSSIGTASVDAGTLTFNVETVIGVTGTLHLVLGNQASGAAIASADFGSVGFVSGGSVAVSSTGLKSIVLNASGLSFINSLGTSKLGLIEARDQSNTDPNPSDYRFSVNLVSNGTAGNRPTLTLSYTPTTAIMKTGKFWGV